MTRTTARYGSLDREGSWTFGKDPWQVIEDGKDGRLVLSQTTNYRPQLLAIFPNVQTLANVTGKLDHNYPAFTLASNRDEVRHVAQTSWDDAPIGQLRGIARRAKSSLAEFESSFATTFDVQGAVVDMGRFLAGEPECMVAPKVTERSARTIRVLVEVAALGDVAASDMAIRGCAVAVLCEALSVMGYAVELVAAGTSDAHSVHRGSIRGNARVAVVVPLVKAGEPMDVQSILFAVAHPAMFRSFIFNAREECFGMSNGGGAATVQNVAPPLTAEVVNPDVHVVTGSEHTRMVARDPEGWIIRTIEEIEQGTFGHSTSGVGAAR